MPAAITGKFASFDQSDVVFLIGRHRLYGKKDLLTYHSTYFKDLFQTNLDSKKSPSEFRIDNVKFDEFSTLISLVQTNPLKITEKNAENLLQLADRFDLPSAKCHVELFLITSEKNRFEKLRIADKYKLERLLEHSVSLFDSKSKFLNENVFLNKWWGIDKRFFGNLAASTVGRLMDHLLEIL